MPLVLLGNVLEFWLSLYFFAFSGENSVGDQESFDNDREPSIGSHGSGENLEDDSDDSGSPPGLYKDGNNSPSPPQRVPNGNTTPILVHLICFLPKFPTFFSLYPLLLYSSDFVVLLLGLPPKSSRLHAPFLWKPIPYLKKANFVHKLCLAILLLSLCVCECCVLGHMSLLTQLNGTKLKSVKIKARLHRSWSHKLVCLGPCEKNVFCT